MRAPFLALSLFPTLALAEAVPLSSDVSAVTLYPQGATIVRQVPFEIEAGTHELVLTDLPRSVQLENVRVSLEGAILGAVTGRRDYVPPRSDVERAEVTAAEAEVERLEGELRSAERDVAAIRLESEAAQARIVFLQGLGTGDVAAAKSAEELRKLGEMIGEEVLLARQAAFEAEARAEAEDRALKDLREALEKARKVLAALETEEDERAMLSVMATSDEAVSGVMTVTYLSYDAGWMPTYDMRLDKRGGTLAITRGAMIAQHTGEDWRGVDLTLSTVRPSEQIEPREVHPWRRQVFEKPQAMMRKSVEASSYAGDSANGGMLMAEPAMVEEAAADVSYDGLAASYRYDRPVDVANRADGLRITLGEMKTDAEVRAFAVPLYDETGFLMGSIENDMGEMILPSQFVNLFVDGRFVGQSYINKVIPVGGEADLAFGAIDGLRLKRNVVRNEGDRGMLSRSTELSEQVKIEVENLTGESWSVRVLDRVPYSEQEELGVSWKASPRVSEQDIDDKRGVLAWEFELGAGAKEALGLSYELRWPEGKVLR